MNLFCKQIRKRMLIIISTDSECGVRESVSEVREHGVFGNREGENIVSSIHSLSQFECVCV